MSERLINAGLPFVGAQSRDLGISPERLRSFVDTSRVRRVFRGVYVDTLAPDTRALRTLALHLVKPADAVFYGATAAFLCGVDAFPPKDRFNFAPQCVVPHHAGRSRQLTVRCREGYLPSEDLIDTEGLLITTPVRTTVDMLRTHWRPHALAAADAMAHAGLVTCEEVLTYVNRLKGYPGIVQARSLAPMIDPQAESPGESWQRLRLIDGGFAAPESQVTVCDRTGRIVARLDNGYRWARVGIDYDGREFHDDDLAKLYDGSKRGYLTDALGWRLAIGRHETIFGTNPAFELQIGEWLGITPLPRRW